MKSRSYQNKEYRYGFNGKENDTDFGNKQVIQDYGFRLYNPSIAKFLSFDPLAKSYPWNSPYSFAENDVIRNLDLDGGEKMPYMEKWEYEGTPFDYITAVSNGTVNIINIVPSFWNSGVETYSSLKRGTYVSDVKSEFTQMGFGIQQWGKDVYEYHANTPILTQLENQWNYTISPQALEFSTTMLVGYQTGNLFPKVGAGLSSGVKEATLHARNHIGNFRQRLSNWNQNKPLYEGVHYSSKPLSISQLDALGTARNAEIAQLYRPKSGQYLTITGKPFTGTVDGFWKPYKIGDYWLAHTHTMMRINSVGVEIEGIWWRASGDDLSVLSRVRAGQRMAGVPIQSKSVIIPDGSVRAAQGLGIDLGRSNSAFGFSLDNTQISLDPTLMNQINRTVNLKLIID